MARAATGSYPFLSHPTIADLDRQGVRPMGGTQPSARRWCDQCEELVHPIRAAACASPFCKARGAS